MTDETETPLTTRALINAIAWILAFIMFGAPLVFWVLSWVGWSVFMVTKIIGGWLPWPPIQWFY